MGILVFLEPELSPKLGRLRERLSTSMLGNPEKRDTDSGKHSTAKKLSHIFFFSFESAASNIFSKSSSDGISDSGIGVISTISDFVMPLVISFAI